MSEINNHHNVMLQKKIDIYFYNSIKLTIRNHWFHFTYQLLKMIALILFLIIYYLSNPLVDFFVMLIVAVINSLFGIFAFLAMQYEFYRVDLAIMIAGSLGHVSQQPKNISNNEDSLENIRSISYDFSNSISEDQSEDNKRKLEGILSLTLTQQYIKDTFIAKNFRNLNNFFSIALVIAFIVGLAQYTKTPAILGFIITYIILQAVAKRDFFFVLLLIALSPLICLICCFYCCCCKQNDQNNPVPVQDIPVMNYKPTKDAATECSICFQNFSIDDKIKTMPCNRSHTFHEICIDSWLKFRPTCPLCRKNLAANANQQ